MIIYRNHNTGREKRSKGFSFHPTRASADAAKTEPPKGTIEIEQDTFDAQLNKAGVLELLRKCASHPNNK
jgi:hypothetical protein